jgi:creatinine amidohydrolase
VNGHGGNTGLKARLTELANFLPDVKIQWYAWWLAHSVEEVAMRHDLKPSHANWLEAFPFTIVTDLPDGEKTPPHVPSDILDARSARKVYGDGSFGGKYRAPQETMEEVFDAALQDILQLLKFE